MQTVNATATVATVSPVAAVVADVMDKAAGGRKLAASVRAMASTIATVQAAADIAGTIRRECLAKADNYLRGAGKNLLEIEQARYRKSVVNAISYAVSELAECYGTGAAIKWNKAKNAYIGTDKAADTAQAEQAAATVSGDSPAMSESEAQAEQAAAMQLALQSAIRAACASIDPDQVLAAAAVMVAEYKAEQAAAAKLAAEQAEQAAAEQLAADKAQAAALAEQLAALQSKLQAADKAEQLAELGAVPAQAEQLAELAKNKGKKRA